MSGKCRPSLRKKALYVVKQSDFSKAVKECISEVFARYESMIEKSKKTEANAIEKSMTEEGFEDDYPCNHCEQTCDHWDAAFCCTLCYYNGNEDCENCDPWDI